MSHRDIVLTPNAKNVLDAMRSIPQKYAQDYLSNPMLQDAANQGERLRLFAAGTDVGTWMEVTLDEHAKVDVQVWKLQGSAAWTTPWNVGASEFNATSLPTTKSNLATLDFRRRQGVVGHMAYAAKHASTSIHSEPFEAMMASLAKYVPWVDQMTTLAHRVHGSAAGPRILAQAMNATALFGDLVDTELVLDMASPCTTAQALLAVHAGAHNGDKPGLYALDAPGVPTTYLFVKHRVSLLFEDNRAANARMLDKANGTHIWMDATGVPIFINADRREGSDAMFADLAQHPDPAMTNIRWMPKEPKGRYGIPDTRDSWDTFMSQGFNASTRALCNQLATATPRALNHEEELDVVNRWLASSVSTPALWEGNMSKRFRTDVHFFATNKTHESLRFWAQYAAAVWSHNNTREYAVLDALLPEMDSLGGIEQWRARMAQMAPHGNPAQPEHIGLPDLREASGTATNADDGPIAW